MPENPVAGTARRFSPIGVRSILGAALLAGGDLCREYALVYRVGRLNKSGPFEVTLRDKLNNFAHLLSPRQEIRRKYSANDRQHKQQLVLGLPMRKTDAHHK